jgi:hypothetical protein
MDERVQKCVKEGDVVRRNSGVLMAKEPTGGVSRGGVEVLRWYLWAFALHWPRLSWYERKIR